MYTLRTVFESGEQHNISMGDSYTVISKPNAPELFDELANQHEVNTEFIYAVVISEKEVKNWVGRQNKNYIVSDSGKTLAKI